MKFELKNFNFSLLTSYFSLIFFSSLLTALAFFPLKLGFLAFFSITPFFFILKKSNIKYRIIYSLIWGLLFNLIILSWLSSVTYAGYISLCLYHTVFIIIFAIAWHILKNSFERATFWIILEFIKDNLFGGSPFGFIGGSLSQFPFLIQLASIGGIHLVSFWIILVNLVLNELYEEKKTGRSGRRLTQILLIIITPFIFGFIRIKSDDTLNNTSQIIKIGIVQPNIPAGLKWNHSKEKEMINILEKTSNSFQEKKLDLIIWPETAIPYDFRTNQKVKEIIKKLCLKYRTRILIGSIDESNPDKDFNSAFLINSDLACYVENYQGNDIYHKINLVPFGEYIPLKKIFSGLKYLTPIKTGFEKGNKLPLFNLSEDITISPLICFEDTLSSFCRKVANNGSSFFVTITNDGWFKPDFGPFSHEALARFRTVENRIPLIRCSNTGISSYINSKGQTVKKLENEKGETVNIQGVLSFELPVEQKRPSIFSLIGNSWIFVLLLTALFIRLLRGT